jgi:hypothetical protein
MSTDASEHEDKRAHHQDAIAFPQLAGALSTEIFRNLIEDIGQGGPRSE